MKNIKPFITGIEGLELKNDEEDFLFEHQPFGVILFARNINDKNQVKSLTKKIKSIIGKNSFILIDQEGGKVARLREPEFWSGISPVINWEICKKARLSNDPEEKKYLYTNSIEASFLHGYLSGKQLDELGINVNCAPMLDLPMSNSHALIRSRAFSDKKEEIVDLAFAFSYGQAKNNIYNIIKHIPGHGRALLDSHFELPIIEEDIEILKESDFYPFSKLSFFPMAMTAHILYNKIDPKNVSTISPKVINLIRNEINFKNILMTDDISMKALNGSIFDLAKKSLLSGCDLVLHCNGKMLEMREVVKAIDSIDHSFEINMNKYKKIFGFSSTSSILDFFHFANDNKSDKNMFLALKNNINKYFDLDENIANLQDDEKIKQRLDKIINDFI